MQKLIVISSIAVSVLGFLSPVFAQTRSNSPSPAQLLGVQERSIQQNSQPIRTAVSLDANQTTNASIREGGFVLYRIDRSTRVLVGPVRQTVPQTGSFSSTSQEGENRLQLLRDLDE